MLFPLQALLKSELLVDIGLDNIGVKRMATELTTEILHGDSATTQVIDTIQITLSANTFKIIIADKNSEGDIIHRQGY